MTCPFVCYCVCALVVMLLLRYMTTDVLLFQAVSFCVADVRQRLKEVSTVPFNTFARDPEDPSGILITTLC